jgi:hypothetical protein
MCPAKSDTTFPVKDIFELETLIDPGIAVECPTELN